MINKLLFKKRIQGLVSYYSGAAENVFAKKKIHKVLVPMSELQWKNQQAIYKKEDDMRKGITEKKGEARSDVEGQIKTLARGRALNVKGQLRHILAVKTTDTTETETQNFFVFSRSNSNMTYPAEILDKYSRKSFPQILDGKKFKEAIPSLNLSENLSLYSPKFNKLLNIINDSKGPVMVYSNFEGAYGISLLAEIFKQNGFEKFNTSISSPEQLESKKRFTLWTGNTKPEERKNILKVYNDAQNSNGDYVKVICITSAGKEGISLRGVRQVHIVDPWWNMNRIKQVIGRAVRICSHAHLPKQEQLVDVYNYFSISPDKSLNHKELLDISISKNAIIKQKQENEMITELKRASLDCSINESQNIIKNCINFQYNKEDIIYKTNIYDEIDDFLDNENMKEINFNNTKYLLKGNQLYEYATNDKLNSGFLPDKLGIASVDDDGNVKTITLTNNILFKRITIRGKDVLLKDDNIYQNLSDDDLSRGLNPMKIGTVQRRDGNIIGFL